MLGLGREPECRGRSFLYLFLFGYSRRRRAGLVWIVVIRVSGTDTGITAIVTFSVPFANPESWLLLVEPFLQQFARRIFLHATDTLHTRLAVPRIHFFFPLLLHIHSDPICCLMMVLCAGFVHFTSLFFSFLFQCLVPAGGHVFPRKFATLGQRARLSTPGKRFGRLIST